MFNQRFTDLSRADQLMHLASIGFTALAAAFIMTPAAYHRALPHDAPLARFLKISARLIKASMFFLAISTASDFAVVSSLIVQQTHVRCGLAAGVFLVLMYCWFVFPPQQARRSK